MFRFIERWVVRILLFVLILAVTAYFTKDRLLKYYLDLQLSKVTGLYLKMGEIHSDITRGTIEVKNVEVYHPAILNKILFAKVPEMKMKVALWDLLFKKVKIEWMDLQIALVQSVDSANGVSTEKYMRQLASNIDSQSLPFQYEGMDILYLTLERHQKVKASEPENVFWFRDLNIRGQRVEKVNTPRQLVELLNNLLYGLDAYPSPRK